MSIIGKKAPKGMDKTLAEMATLTKALEKKKAALDKKMEEVAPFKEDVDTATARLSELREKIVAFVIARDEKRYQSAHGLVEKTEGRWSVMEDETDFSLLPEEFVRKSVNKTLVLSAFKEHNETPPPGAVVRRGDPIVKIML